MVTPVAPSENFDALVRDLCSLQPDLIEALQAGEMSQSRVADLRFLQMQIVEIRQGPQVNQSGIGYFRFFQIQAVELLQSAQVSQTGVADLSSIKDTEFRVSSAGSGELRPHSLPPYH